MSLQGWRLFGLSATIILYIGGVLILSMNNIPGTHPRRVRIERFAEFANYRNPRFSTMNRKMTIRWCKELTFLALKDLPNYKTFTAAITTLTATTSQPPSQPPTPQPPSTSLKNIYNLKKTKRKQSLAAATKTHYRTAPQAPIFEQQHQATSWHAATTKSTTTTTQQTAIPGLTALASFPGSGNTWLRYVLQQATGIFTGSIYKDYGLMKTGFPAENVCNNSVLVVKTHEWGAKAAAPFSKAILLVRDPEKAILAEFNRRSGGHIGFASPDGYKRRKGQYWQQFVANKLKGWEAMNLYWARNFTGNLKVVFYDDLINDLENVLRDILSFLDFPVEEPLINCALMRREGIFRRKKRMLPFDPYTPAMHAQIRDRREMVYNALGRNY